MVTFTYIGSRASNWKASSNNGLASGHNAATGFAESLELATAAQPVLSVKTLLEEAERLGMPDGALKEQLLESGGEDMPDVYRWLPIKWDHHRLNIVATYSVELQV